MPSRRVQKAAQAIREVVSMAILTDLNDPRVQDVTVTYVEVSPDMRQAKIHVSIMGDDAKQRLSLHGLKSAAGYLQSKVANRIQTRYTPRLEFVLDLGVKKSIEIAQILQRVLPPKIEAGPALEDSSPGEGDDDDGQGQAGSHGGAHALEDGDSREGDSVDGAESRDDSAPEATGGDAGYGDNIAADDIAADDIAADDIAADDIAADDIAADNGK